jgi:hypothetical protein
VLRVIYAGINQGLPNRRGELAAEALGNAISEVEGKMAGIAASMVEQLGEQAGGLAQGQRQLGEST